MYVARDESGFVYLYTHKPIKYNKRGCWGGNGHSIFLEGNSLPKSINPKWEDPEPMEVKLVRKNK